MGRTWNILEPYRVARIDEGSRRLTTALDVKREKE
jgi:hypothetical protein